MNTPGSELRVIQLETTNICNADCVFCPHHKFTEYGIINDDLYKSIVDNAANLNLDHFIPMLTGEPFCDPKFIDRLRYAREKLDCTLDVYTNGSLLTKDVIDELKEIDNLNISVSLNGMCADTRLHMMGLNDFNEVVESIKYMNEVGISHRATMVTYPDIPNDELAAFHQTGNKLVPYQSWCGEQYKHNRMLFSYCTRADTYMTIKYNGDVCLCCFDPFGKVVFGNLNTETIEEIWDSDKHRYYQDIESRKLDLCRHCTEP